MSTKLSQVAQYYYDRQKLARAALAKNNISLPLEKGSMIKKHLQNPHKRDQTVVYQHAQSELLLSSHFLSKEYENISEVHQNLERMTSDRPPSCRRPRRTINGPSARYQSDWDQLTPAERQARLRATVVRAGQPKLPPRIRLTLRHLAFERKRAAMALRRLHEKEKPVSDILEKHAKFNGCPTEHNSEDKSARFGAKLCAARAEKVFEDKARNIKLLREVEALHLKAVNEELPTEALYTKPLSAVPIKTLKRFHLEKNFADIDSLIEGARGRAAGCPLE